MLALEVVEDGFDALHPDVAVIQVHPVLAERQAEQRAVEQTHQAFHVLLAELLAQACVAVVVGVFELLADVLQAFFQVAQALFQVFAGELPRMGQGAGQFVVGILGGEQLLFEDLGVVDQGEAGLEHRQLAEPALDAGDLALQTHQLLGAAALFVLQAVLLGAVLIVLDQQFLAARPGVVVPGAEQAVEQRRKAVHLAAQYVALGHAVGQGFHQRAGGDQRLVVLLHPPHVAERLLAGGDVVDVTRAQAVLEGVEEQLLELGRGDLAHVQQVDEQRAEGLQALLAGGA